MSVVLSLSSQRDANLSAALSIALSVALAVPVALLIFIKIFRFVACSIDWFVTLTGEKKPL